MYTRYLCMLIGLILLCIGSSSFAQVSEPAPPRGITVTGNGEVQGKPDIAFVTLGVQTENKEAAKAASTNATTTTAVINAIVRAGITKNDIQTVNYSLSSFSDYVPSKEMNVPPTQRTGFRATNEVQVKVRDLAKAGAVVDAAISAGANAARNISFAIEDDSALQKEALAKAVQDAESKAKAIAAASDVKLLSPISIIENGSTPSPRPMMMASMRSDMGTPTPIMPGELKISVGVTVVYAFSAAGP